MKTIAIKFRFADQNYIRSCAASWIQPACMKEAVSDAEVIMLMLK
jgi:hypothetical protein